MTKTMSGFGFRGMAFFFGFRDLFSPPKKILEKAGIKANDTIVDYGCGPGGYTLSAAQLVKPSGKVYAIDIHPLAKKMIIRKAQRKGLSNIECIQSDCQTGLEQKSVDMVLLYDVLHMLRDYESNVKEFHRILKPEGILSVNDHHYTEEVIIRKIITSGFFELKEQNGKTYNFSKIN